MEIKKNDWKVWLILSTFGIEFREWYNCTKEQAAEYDATWRKGEKWYNVTPQDICTFRKMFIISLIMFPFSYMSHAFNLIWRTKDASAWKGLVAFVIFFLLTTGFSQPGSIEKPNVLILSTYAQAHCFSITEKLLFYYACTPLVMLTIAALFGCLGLLLFGVCWPFVYLNDLYKERKEKKDINQKIEAEVKESTNFIYVMYKSIKDKYCTKITYVE